MKEQNIYIIEVVKKQFHYNTPYYYFHYYRNQPEDSFTSYSLLATQFSDYDDALKVINQLYEKRNDYKIKTIYLIEIDLINNKVKDAIEFKNPNRTNTELKKDESSVLYYVLSSSQNDRPRYLKCIYDSKSYIWTFNLSEACHFPTLKDIMTFKIKYDKTYLIMHNKFLETQIMKVSLKEDNNLLYHETI